MNKVEFIRKSRQVSLQILADAVGITPKTLRSIELGRYMPSLNLAVRISRYFSLSVEYLFEMPAGAVNWSGHANYADRALQMLDHIQHELRQRHMDMYGEVDMDHSYMRVLTDEFAKKFRTVESALLTVMKSEELLVAYRRLVESEDQRFDLDWNKLARIETLERELEVLYHK